jgi:hypothetical protein
VIVQYWLPKALIGKRSRLEDNVSKIVEHGGTDLAGSKPGPETVLIFIQSLVDKTGEGLHR